MVFYESPNRILKTLKIFQSNNADLKIAVGRELSKIFEDLIKSGKVPVTMLTEVFRYKSNGSLFVATNVRQGKSFFEDKENVKYQEGIYSIGSNYKFIEKQDDEVFDEAFFVSRETTLSNSPLLISFSFKSMN